jgi:hypothetical protein
MPHRLGLVSLLILVLQCFSVPYFPSHVDKVNILFGLFDVEPRDGYLGFAELRLFQQLTDPHLPLDWREYRAVIRLLGSGRTVGLTLAEFNSSYYEFRHVLGTDLDRDFDKIMLVVSGLSARAW